MAHLLIEVHRSLHIKKPNLADYCREFPNAFLAFAVAGKWTKSIRML
jgi:hypothetical protein